MSRDENDNKSGCLLIVVIVLGMMVLSMSDRIVALVRRVERLEQRLPASPPAKES